MSSISQLNAPSDSPLADIDAMEEKFKAADEAGKLRRAQAPKVISIKIWNGEGYGVKSSERGRMVANLYAEYDVAEYVRNYCGCDYLAARLDVSYANIDKSFDLDGKLNAETLSFLRDIVKKARHFNLERYIEETFDENESAVLTQRKLNYPLGVTHIIHLHSDFWMRKSTEIRMNEAGKLINHINHMFFDMGGANILFKIDEDLAYGWEMPPLVATKRFKKAVEESLLAEKAYHSGPFESRPNDFD